jgi:class 3 adenylate cyclase
LNRDSGRREAIDDDLPMSWRAMSMLGMKSEGVPQVALTFAPAKLLAIRKWMRALASRNGLVRLGATAALIIAPSVSAAASAMIGIEAWAGHLVLTVLLTATWVVTHQRRRSDQVGVSGEAHVPQDMVPRYVPDAVATQLESGRPLACGEREITVLFADMRGYTGFSEDRTPAEIFATVNRFTERVSAIVLRHRGSVVEFGGDGIMAVFGAPNTLPQKERAAVEAGRAIVATIRSATAATGESDALSVGVGIATGTDFVGNVQIADGEIWTAVGNTANLAARLQALTRRFAAAIAIDEPTRAASAGAAAAFERHPSIPIRGRRDRQNVYVLPLCSESRRLNTCPLPPARPLC